MTRKTPGYLRLHVEDALSSERPPLEDFRCLTTLCDAFQRTTGWTLRLNTGPDTPEDCVWAQQIGEQEGAAVPSLILEAPGENEPGDGARSIESRTDVESVRDLAAAVVGLVRELHRTRHGLWQREAELAAGVPVAPHADEETQLATRLEMVLKAGAQAVKCQAAAAYMLDDGTKQLKLRTCWGLPKSRFLDPPRPLRGAAADLEALVGHAVVLEDTRLLTSWRVPEEFRSAVCVPISSPTVPFGTLWMFSDTRRGFTIHETNMIEIVAGRLAADLEREMLLHQTLQTKRFQRQLAQAAAAQRSRLPRIKPLLSGWQVAGWTVQRDCLGGDFHDWFLLPDGALAVALGDAQGKMFEAGSTCATVQTALRSHASYRHSAQQMVERVNETLWTASSGDQFASLFYGLIQPGSGAVECAVAGEVSVTAIGDSLQTWALDGGVLLGSQPDGDYPAHRGRLALGEMLVVLSGGLHETLVGERKRDFWQLLRSHHRDAADDLINRVKGLLDQYREEPTSDDWSVVLVQREAP